ncbi:hypothetical protein K438DRAFT_1968717 [Mycena galopus ATCC 62051]|nr:hypothetical protein K438DRAFT_1968717 [Mycena galopus ATCC 62051]
MHRSSAVSSIPQEVPLSLGHASSSTPFIRQRCRTTTVFSPTTAAPDPPHDTSAGSDADDLQHPRRRLPATAPLVIVTSLSMVFFTLMLAYSRPCPVSKLVNPPVQERVLTATGANEKGGGYNGDEAQIGEWGLGRGRGCQLSVRVGTVTSGARSSGGRGAGSGKPQMVIDIAAATYWDPDFRARVEYTETLPDECVGLVGLAFSDTESSDAWSGAKYLPGSTTTITEETFELEHGSGGASEDPCFGCRP